MLLAFPVYIGLTTWVFKKRKEHLFRNDTLIYVLEDDVGSLENALDTVT